jgi:hypothetical protein
MTEAERERLIMLIEECAEVIQAATKCLRHGYESRHPDGGETNLEYLERELADLHAVRWAMAEQGDAGVLSTAGIWERKLRYTHHQEPLP